MRNSLSSEKKIIDILKLFFSFCVVATHTDLLNNLPSDIAWWIMHLVFRLAVPFFCCEYFFKRREIKYL